MATRKQIEANRRNSKDHATGPKTVQGKRKSSANANKLGLSGPGIVLPEQFAAEVNDRFTHWEANLRPFDLYDRWLCEQVTIESVRVDLCQRHYVALTHEQARRAKTSSWDKDQMIEVE